MPDPSPPRTTSVGVVCWSPDVALDRADEVWPVYDAVFGDRPGREDWREATYDRHCARTGFRMAAALDGERLVGFGYGYVGERGQYWPDRVVGALPAELADTWVGGHFELVELAVLPDHRGLGLGRALHDEVMAGAGGRRSLLGTDEAETPAVRLYRSAGWITLGRLEPGVQIMGLIPVT